MIPFALAVTLTLTLSTPLQRRTPPPKPAPEEDREALFKRLAEWEQSVLGVEDVYWINVKTRVRTRSGIVKAWFKIEPTAEGRPRTVNFLRKYNPSLDAESYSYMLSFYEFNCQERLLRVVEDIFHTKKGAVLTSIVTKDAEWLNIPPDSIAEALYETACQK